MNIILGIELNIMHIIFSEVEQLKYNNNNELLLCVSSIVFIMVGETQGRRV